MAVKRPYADDALRHAVVSAVILAITAAVLVAQGRATTAAPSRAAAPDLTVHHRDGGTPVIVIPAGADAESLASFMKQAGIARASLVGPLAATGVAARFAVQHPELVDALVMVDERDLHRTVRDLLRSGS